jgi:hypothetical protein
VPYSGDYTITNFNKGPRQASQLLDDRQLTILDIGADHGGFAYHAQQLGHTAHALSLYDYRDDPDNSTAWHLEPGSYIVGNPDRLSQIDGLLDNYDLIVSDHAFPRLVDPLGALEQAIDKLAAGGILAINGITSGRGYGPGNRIQTDVNSGLVYDELLDMDLVFTMTDAAKQPGYDNSFDLYAHHQGVSGTAIKAAFRFDYEKLSNGWTYATESYKKDRSFLDT